jgi:hypothetical protein
MHIRYDLSEVVFYGGAIAVLLLLAFFAPHRGGRPFRCVERLLAKMARRRALAVTLVGFVSLVAVICLAWIAGVPIPGVHDEFTYLLAADTFAHGRLTNPPHPLWVHFESFHLLQQPTYAAIYPPGQGLMLALGQILGHPIIGVWLSTALACAAICWMLMAWVRPRWALVGALLAVVHPEVLIWSQRYFGGAVALAGGALALGGFRRIMQQPRWRDGALMGAGIGVLVNSRPYEGAVLSLILVTILVVWTMKQRSFPVPVVMVRVALPLAIVLCLIGTWMAYYNWRVTGDALRLPYQVYQATYQTLPTFPWQSAPALDHSYHHKVIAKYWNGYALRQYTKQRTLAGYASGLAGRFWKHTRSSLRLWFFVVPLVALPWAVKRDKWMQLALLIGILFLIALLQVYWTNFHYAAPAFGLFFAFVVQSMRSLSLWRPRDKPVGLFLARGTLILCAVSVVHTFAVLSRHSPDAWNAQRAQLLARLQHDGGKHLIIVRYAPQHSPHDEWVYNEADIDAARVVWAREMDDAHNHQLLDYFNDRHIWLLEPDVSPVRLIAYPQANGG